MAIFAYVGAEVAIGSVMISYLNRPDILGVTLADAGWYTGWVYWFGALIGRFIGSALLLRVRAERLLLVAAGTACLLAVAAGLGTGIVAGVAPLSIGLFNSVMFPTIFTLTLERTNAPLAATSGLLCLAIVGGAVIPLCVGIAADYFDLGPALLLPATAYAVVVGFALKIKRLPMPRPTI